MTEPATRLQSALADRYRIEREAAVIGAERFLREIKTIATLQHPHILGLIDSGEVNGTAYYVMPFVEGESLRDRRNRENQLPIADETWRRTTGTSSCSAGARDARS